MVVPASARRARLREKLAGRHADEPTALAAEVAKRFYYILGSLSEAILLVAIARAAWKWPPPKITPALP